MTKKNASLAALANVAVEPPTNQPETRKIQPAPKPESDDEAKATKRTFVYMAPAVHKQLRQLAFDENQTMSSLFLKGLDLIFKQQGLKSIRDLTGKDPE